MANFNRVMLMGNLTRDPELKYIQSGSAVCNLRMAINRKYRSKAGEDREEVCQRSGGCWRRPAGNSFRIEPVQELKQTRGDIDRFLATLGKSVSVERAAEPPHCLLLNRTMGSSLKINHVNSLRKAHHFGSKGFGARDSKCGEDRNKIAWIG